MKWGFFFSSSVKRVHIHEGVVRISSRGTRAKVDGSSSHDAPGGFYS